ncbi:Lipase family protein [Planoprotostelium fungivorum]|uniref:Lipase family protein n=1 Tax=Planoprotostelium fungivorum TaxID=1890364 RepID=A0A2P6NNQ3_9EUKA|nr:Lipase family protein [Planoprotostelium fungivorum]
MTLNHTILICIFLICVHSVASSDHQPTYEEAKEKIYFAYAASSSRQNLSKWYLPEFPDAPRANVTGFFDGIDNNIFGYAAVTSNYIVLTFRALSTSIDLYDSEIVVQTPVSGMDQSIAVHLGWYTAYLSIQKQLRLSLHRLTAEYPTLPVHIVGYSFGGPLATLAAADVLHHQLVPSEKLHLWTYGSPRVGNLAFSQWMNAKLLHSVRVTHGRDPVIHLPIILMGYVHIDDEYWMDEVNGVHWKRCKETEADDPEYSVLRITLQSVGTDIHETQRKRLPMQGPMVYLADDL